MKFREKHNQKIPEQENPFWLSIGDLMSGLLLIFILLLLVVLYRLVKESEKSSVTRSSLLKILKQELQNQKIDVDIDMKNGTITIKEDVLFGYNRTNLKKDGRLFLQKFIPTFANIVFSRSEYRDEITRIIVEGHTDQRGSSEINLRLSLLRAFTVASFIISKDCIYLREQDRKELLARLLPSGRGKLDAHHSFSDDRARRVIFRIQFKDLSVIDSWKNLQQHINHNRKSVPSLQ